MCIHTQGILTLEMRAVAFKGWDLIILWHSIILQNWTLGYTAWKTSGLPRFIIFSEGCSSFSVCPSVPPHCFHSMPVYLSHRKYMNLCWQNPPLFFDIKFFLTYISVVPSFIFDYHHVMSSFLTLNKMMLHLQNWNGDFNDFTGIFCSLIPCPKCEHG